MRFRLIHVFVVIQTFLLLEFTHGKDTDDDHKLTKPLIEVWGKKFLEKVCEKSEEKDIKIMNAVCKLLEKYPEHVKKYGTGDQKGRQLIQNTRPRRDPWADLFPKLPPQPYYPIGLEYFITPPPFYHLLGHPYYTG